MVKQGNREAPRSCEDLLRAMVGIDTVNGRISGRTAAERELAVYLESLAGAFGFPTRRLPIRDDSFNLILTHEIDAAAPWLLFESHMDTVTVEGMTIDPFGGEIRGGRMWGRGACDTKGSGAAMLWALKQYAGQSDQPNNIAIAYTTDEESLKEGAKALASDQLPRFTWRPVGVVVGEPTLLRPVVAHNGAVRWKIRAQGVSCHSCDPSLGKSAISMMVKVIDALESRYIPALTASHPLIGKAQCSINLIEGGTQINVIPESCAITIDRRLAPGEDMHKVLPEVETLLDELRRSDPDLNVSQDDPFLDPALDPEPNKPFLGFVQGVLAEMGLPTDPSGVSYGTDASQFSAEGMPAVIIGPGSIDQAHTKDEWLELDQLERSIDVYRNLMSRSVEGGGRMPNDE